MGIMVRIHNARALLVGAALVLGAGPSAGRCRDVGGPGPVKDVRNPDPSGKIPAIKAAVEEHDPAAVRQLVKDLDSDDGAVRFFAIEALERLTGETFAYHYYDDEDERRPAVLRWRQWLAEWEAAAEENGVGMRTGTCARDGDGTGVTRVTMADRSTHPAGATTRDAGVSGAGRLELNVTSDPANLAAVRQACEAFCEAAAWTTAAAGDVGLCVNEAMANVMRHAYGGATDRPVVVTAEPVDRRRGPGVRITIRDWGNGVNPLAAARRSRATRCSPAGWA